MKIFFQEKDFKYNKELDLFSKKNKKAGSIVSFLGKVRPKNNNKKLKYMEIGYTKWQFSNKKNR